jgi:hypothetical protein
MQPEIFRFLLLARAHLRDGATLDRVHADHADMQAPDRTLPDADWFEVAEFEAPSHARSVGLWNERGALQFE